MPATGGASDDADPASPPPGDAPSRTAGPDIGPVRPILLLGAGFFGGGFSLGADLGLRLGPVTARFAWRGEFLEEGDYLTMPSGRLGWIFAESSWLGAHVGVGAGRLTRSYADPAAPPSARAVAVVGELGVLFWPAFGVGPLIAVNVEALAPVGTVSPAGASLSAPALSVTVSFNALVVLAHAAGVRP